MPSHTCIASSSVGHLSNSGHDSATARTPHDTNLRKACVPQRCNVPGRRWRELLSRIADLEHQLSLRHRGPKPRIAGRLLPPGIPARLAAIPTRLAMSLDLGKRGSQVREFGQRHLLAVRQHPTQPDQASKIAIQPPDGALAEPMQRGRREHGVELELGQSVGPPCVVQVSPHDPHAVVVGERCRRDGEQHRIDVHSDRARPWQPIEQPECDGARTTRQVEHGRGRAGRRLDDVEQDAQPKLTVGHEIVFELVPRSLPRLSPSRRHGAIVGLARQTAPLHRRT
jgi:hypothetical protein